MDTMDTLDKINQLREQVKGATTLAELIEIYKGYVTSLTQSFREREALFCLYNDLYDTSESLDLYEQFREAEMPVYNEAMLALYKAVESKTLKHETLKHKTPKPKR